MSEHVVPVRVYLMVFGALMLLTALTYWAAFQNFGLFNTAIALGIAGVKATLVILYFMHVRYGGRLVRVMLASALIWLAILLVITLADYASRGWLTAPGA